MKFGGICEKLQPSGDINAFMVKKQLMSSIFGIFLRLNYRYRQDRIVFL